MLIEVHAYLDTRHGTARRLTAEIERHQDPKERLLAGFDVLAATVAQPGFRGCTFANAVAESELDGPAADVTRNVRRWLLDTMVELTTALGAADPAGLARQLTLLYDGRARAVEARPNPAAAEAARAAANAPCGRGSAR